MTPSADQPYVLTCAQMRAVEHEVIAGGGVPSLLLMENAGRGVAEVVLGLREIRAAAVASGLRLDVAIVCGPGNNGGDGFVVARHLALAGAGVRVLLAAPPEKSTGDAGVMLRALRGIPQVTISELASQTDVTAWGRALAGAHLIVDAVFGTGLRDDVAGAPAAAIAAMNAAPATKVSVDIPSGLDGDSGRPHGSSVRADVTVTMGARKLGLVIDPEAGVGQIVVVGLGCPLTPDPAIGPFGFWTQEALVRAALPSRKGAAHKGSSGHLVIVAGSRGKSGAALLASRAALRTGAGLVTVASTAAGQIALDAKVVEAMTAAFSQTEDAGAESLADILALCARPGVRAVAIGPGIPTGPGMRQVVEQLSREITLPTVLDADGLNLLGSQAAAILAGARGPRIVTPHPGEMARLSGLTTERVQADRLNTARRFAAASRAIVVLKGARTLVVAPDGTAFINPTVEPALATAGSGDVLTGVVGALLAQGMEPASAARAGVFLHGCAGSRAAAVHGSTGVIAGDLPEAVAAVRAAWSAETAAAWSDAKIAAGAIEPPRART